MDSILKLIVLSAVLLQGCASVPSADSGQAINDNSLSVTSVANESLLKAAGNHVGLIDLYKEQLLQAETIQEADSSRYQLGLTYLEAHDPESTLFYIDPVAQAKRANADTLLLQSRALLALEKTNEALQSATDAQAMDGNDPRITNQLGLIYSHMGDYQEARRFFRKAREGMLDDAIVMNNLAMIDILEKNYKEAVDRLMPLYNTGQADDRVIANLVVALVRGKMYDEFKSVYTGAETEQERIELYRAISDMENLSLPE